MGRGQDVQPGHEDPGAPRGDADSGGEGVIQEEVVAFDVEASVSAVDLPPYSSASGPIRVLRVALRPWITLHVHGGEGARAVPVQRLEGQLVRLWLFVMCLVEAAGVTVRGEVQLGSGAKVRARERRGGVGHQRGDVGGRQLQEGQGPGQEELQKVQQCLSGAVVWRQHGDDGHTPGSDS